MNASGVSFDFLAARITDANDQRAATMMRRGSVNLAPVIEEGVTYPPLQVPSFTRYRSPDKFSHFEITLTVPWWRALLLRRLLHKKVALELWTRSDEDYIQWLFPYTTWKRKGWTRFEGRSHEGPGVMRDDIPANQPVTIGAWWKVKTVP